MPPQRTELANKPVKRIAPASCPLYVCRHNFTVYSQRFSSHLQFPNATFNHNDEPATRTSSGVTIPFNGLWTTGGARTSRPALAVVISCRCREGLLWPRASIGSIRKMLLRSLQTTGMLISTPSGTASEESLSFLFLFGSSGHGVNCTRWALCAPWCVSG